MIVNAKLLKLLKLLQCINFLTKAKLRIFVKSFNVSNETESVVIEVVTNETGRLYLFQLSFIKSVLKSVTKNPS